jgi:cytochrome c-type biogenesis protein CcmE
MKKTHIILLVLIAGAIAVLINFLKVSATYDSFASAKENPGKFMHVIAKLDRSAPLEYDQLKNPNYLGFTAVDSTGTTMKVIYRKGKPENIEHSERLVLKGKYENGQFECKDILMKCPSKYKEDMSAAEKNIQKATETQQPVESDKKY